MQMSRNRENYSINQRNLFDEVYGLASTQACVFALRLSFCLVLC